jgi:hypothetical protein
MAWYVAGIVRRHEKALVAFSLAFSLKPQAVFLAPLLLVLVLQRRFSPLLLYLVPAVYLLLQSQSGWPDVPSLRFSCCMLTSVSCLSPR